MSTDLRSTDLRSADLRSGDPELAELLELEVKRQSTTLALIPSENYVSSAVLAACGSVLTNKYSEGYPGRRYYEGQQVIDQVETLAINRAKAVFGTEHANVQPYSGSPANLAVYLAFAQPGDTVMGMSLPMGGHLTHGWGVSATGAWFRGVQYGVRHGRWHGGQLMGFDAAAGDYSRGFAAMYRFADGQIAERWAVRDDLTMLRQLGSLDRG